MAMRHESSDPLEKLEQRVVDFVPTRKHDAYVVVSIEEAIAAAREGNIGVGAVIVNSDGEIVQRGHNHVFHPHFRSDLHAEMDAMNKFEERFKEVTNLRDYTLCTSLEPCPMCLTRLISSGVGKTYYAARDVEGSMVHRLNEWPPAWVNLAAKQEFAPADCSEELSEIAFQVFLATVEMDIQTLIERRT